jgi:uncharacterized pyridoxal phosphate-containing UPF0001 family protein
MEPFADQLAKVQATIAEAAARAGRDPGEVSLVAVSKNASAGSDSGGAQCRADALR